MRDERVEDGQAITWKSSAGRVGEGDEGVLSGGRQDSYEIRRSLYESQGSLIRAIIKE